MMNKPLELPELLHFDSQYRIRSPFAEQINNNSIKNEPMFFNCDLSFAFKHGGPITRSFIEALPTDWKIDDVVFDSRVHMLMKGWYPCIPGWHHDDVPRRSGPNGQPDYRNPFYKSEHIMGIVNAGICPTRLAIGQISLPEITGGVVYKEWHPMVEDAIDKGVLREFNAMDRRLISFDWQTFHEGTKAVEDGWRWFGRLSRKTERTQRITNEIRVNAQVYLENPNDGW